MLLRWGAVGAAYGRWTMGWIMGAGLAMGLGVDWRLGWYWLFGVLLLLQCGFLGS